MRRLEIAMQLQAKPSALEFSVGDPPDCLLGS